MRWLPALALVGPLIGAQPASAEAPKRLDIVTMSDAPELTELEHGLVEGLRELGLPEGTGVTIDFKSAQANFGTAQQIIRQFVGDQPDVLISITTAPSQAAASATRDIPVVFSAVTDPVRARIVSREKHPGGNVTGVSDEVPYGRQMDLIRDIIPGVKRLGIVYDPGMDNSLSAIDKLKPEADRLGFTLVLSPAVSGNTVAAAGQNLVGRADAMYVPNDTTVLAAIESLVKVAQDAQLPLFTGERRSVQRGAIATIGYDNSLMGRATAKIVKQILDGAKPGDIDVLPMGSLPDSISLAINPKSAAKMGVTIPAELLAKAQVF